MHHTAKTVNAITNGASDFILYDNLDSPYYQDEVINKILHVAASLTVNGQKKSTIQLEKNREQKPPRTMKRKKKASIGVKLPFDSIVAIGTSTGGPKAPANRLKFVAEDISGANRHRTAYAERLYKIARRPIGQHMSDSVKEAVDGEKLEARNGLHRPRQLPYDRQSTIRNHNVYRC